MPQEYGRIPNQRMAKPSFFSAAKPTIVGFAMYTQKIRGLVLLESRMKKYERIVEKLDGLAAQLYQVNESTLHHRTSCV